MPASASQLHSLIASVKRKSAWDSGSQILLMLVIPSSPRWRHVERVAEPDRMKDLCTSFNRGAPGALHRAASGLSKADTEKPSGPLRSFMLELLQARTLYFITTTHPGVSSCHRLLAG